jgi:TPR repeat protein
MSTDPPAHTEAVAWYALAAQVQHHSVPVPIIVSPDSSSSIDSDIPVDGAADSGSSENAMGAPPHPDALYNLGLMYYDGLADVVPKDRKRAVEYFKRAGMHMLLSMHHRATFIIYVVTSCAWCFWYRADLGLVSQLICMTLVPCTGSAWHITLELRQRRVSVRTVVLPCAT